jgi:hypothetical protein
MTIWILALVLFVGLVLAGYSQGAVRVLVSLVGLVFSALLAVPMSRLVSPVVAGLLGVFGVRNPILIWAVSPVVTFFILLILFKVGGFVLHRKIEVHYRYKAGDLRLALWERMNKRVGACLGLVNGLVYLLLISVVVYEVSYCTTQMVTGDAGPKLVLLVNRMGSDLGSTGLIDPAPETYYEASDIVGLIYHNPLTQGRLSRYPGFLVLSERQEFQDLTNDKDFMEMLERQSPIMEILNNPKTQNILGNPALLKDIWALMNADLHDLHAYVQTGQSAKYDGEPLLGRWTFDTAASVSALKQSRPNMSMVELRRVRQLLIIAFGKASLTAMPDHQVILKDVVPVKPNMIPRPDMAGNVEKHSGQWQNNDGKYSLTLDGKELAGAFVKDKLKLTGDWTPVVFSHED